MWKDFFIVVGAIVGIGVVLMLSILASIEEHERDKRMVEACRRNPIYSEKDCQDIVERTRPTVIFVPQR